VQALTVGMAAQLLDLSPSEIRRLCNRGTLRCWRTPEGHRRLERRQVEALRAHLHGNGSAKQRQPQGKGGS